jgi:hypothetical protein
MAVVLNDVMSVRDLPKRDLRLLLLGSCSHLPFGENAAKAKEGCGVALAGRFAPFGPEAVFLLSHGTREPAQGAHPSRPSGRTQNIATDGISCQRVRSRSLLEADH